MENTAKNFALQVGSLITLYVSIGALISLVFSIITVLYPDSAQYAWEYGSATATIRTTIAILVVFFPTYIILTRMVNTIRRTEVGTYLKLTKWLVYISLLIGGGVLLGDLVMVLTGFLNGELTIRFVLKALTVLVVVGSAFVYYLADVKGYWQTHEKNSIQYAAVASLLVILAIVYGFTKTESPSEVREKNIDSAQINDLNTIQSYIESYAVVNGELPNSLTEAFGGLTIPEASEGRADYSYEVVNDTNFKLCAEFAFATDILQDRSAYLYEPKGVMMIENAYNWDHAEGVWCFERKMNDVDVRAI